VRDKGERCKDIRRVLICQRQALACVSTRYVCVNQVRASLTIIIPRRKGKSLAGPAATYVQFLQKQGNGGEHERGIAAGHSRGVDIGKGQITAMAVGAENSVCIFSRQLHGTNANTSKGFEGQRTKGVPRAIAVSVVC
jgi:hypothetical protein